MSGEEEWIIDLDLIEDDLKKKKRKELFEVEEDEAEWGIIENE